MGAFPIRKLIILLRVAGNDDFLTSPPPCHTYIHKHHVYHGSLGWIKFYLYDFTKSFKIQGAVVQGPQGRSHVISTRDSRHRRRKRIASVNCVKKACKMANTD